MKASGTELTVVLGGISSGKSEFAEALISEAHKKAVPGSRFYYFTPAPPPGDEEMALKIATHRSRRPAWLETVECGDKPAEMLGLLKKDDLILFDSAGTLAGSLIMKDPQAAADEISSQLESSLVGFLRKLHGIGVSAVLVSEEVGYALVSEHESGRKFQKVMGSLNQRIAAAADSVYLVTAGIPVKIK